MGTSVASRWDNIISKSGDLIKQQLKKLQCTQGARTRTLISHKIVCNGSRSTYETCEELIIIQHGADIGNAFLCGKFEEKCCIIAGPEFGLTVPFVV